MGFEASSENEEKLEAGCLDGWVCEDDSKGQRGAW